MAGIYIHIPFCKQACPYCNFHFSTSLKRKNELIAALLKETELRKDYLPGEGIGTIYFGGGTPSLLTVSDCRLQIEKIRNLFPVANDAEITLEANPDDITDEKLNGWKEAGINRLSIGIQSFFDEDLQWMNRAHNAEQAINNLLLAMKHFKNLTIDLIYGYPLLTDEKWKQNIEKALSFKIPHISCYALTAEPATLLQKKILLKKEKEPDPEKQANQFLFLIDQLHAVGYEHYEISSFSLPGFRSRHNSAYWQGIKYLGLGPSAHSYDGDSRQWNVSNNNIYIESLKANKLLFEKEILTPKQKINEYIMTSLRTINGIELNRLDRETRELICSKIKKYTERGLVNRTTDNISLTREGKLMADGIASDLFLD